MASRYQRLEERSFRLLSFLDDSGLSLHLQAYRLDEAPTYVALSYTWGRASNREGRSNSSTYSIVLDGESVEVQQNLHDAFRYLSHLVREKHCWFWVDAVCINQRDFDERSGQATMMKDIYQRANTVLAWLGIPFDDERIRLGIKLMREFNLYFSGDLKLPNYQTLTARVTQSHLGFPNSSTSEVWTAWEGIAEIIELRYWERLWIYQEVTALRPIRFFYGNHSFDDALLFSTVYISTSFHQLLGFNDRFYTYVFGYASFMLIARLGCKMRKCERLFELVDEMHITACTDPRDRIFAPLGHASDVTPDQITVDYQKNLIDVYVG